VVKKELIAPVKLSITRHLRTALSEYDVRVGPDILLNGRTAALLFGPPGTSKTSFAEAVAHRLGWPFLELSPSDFLRGGLPGIYDRVNEVFADLMDLFGVVILFDEMDALVQSREDRANAGAASTEAAPQLDVTQKFLTTSMLPKLLKLRALQRTVFFMATNHQRDFDPAIKRKGRFDLLIRMGPPSYEEKIKGLDQWVRKEPENEKPEIKKLITEWTAPTHIREAFNLFTYGEVGAFFDFVRQKGDSSERLLAGLNNLNKAGFEKAIDDWSKSRITLRGGTLDEYNGDDANVYPIQ
jgi:SpoVK/Ycf46/Vps4 family AAA+-type ATPase